MSTSTGGRWSDSSVPRDRQAPVCGLKRSFVAGNQFKKGSVCHGGDCKAPNSGRPCDLPFALGLKLGVLGLIILGL